MWELFKPVIAGPHVHNSLICFLLSSLVLFSLSEVIHAPYNLYAVVLCRLAACEHLISVQELFFFFLFSPALVSGWVPPSRQCSNHRCSVSNASHFPMLCTFFLSVTIFCKKTTSWENFCHDSGCPFPRLVSHYWGGIANTVSLRMYILSFRTHRWQSGRLSIRKSHKSSR